WQTKLVYASHVTRKLAPPFQFGADYPEWEFLDKFGDSMFTRLAWAAGYVWFYLHFSPSAWFLLLLPIHFLMGVIHGAIVNWCGHRYGYRTFSIGDKSRNTLPLDVLTMGELYQNNHHRFPNRLHFAVRWFEVDLAYPIIWLLQQARIVRPVAFTAKVG